MPDIPPPADSIPAAHPDVPPTVGPDQSRDRTAAKHAQGTGPLPAAHRVGWGFISLYALAYIGTVLLFLAPLLVSLR